jgi:osmoprotectant transport system substrate-binding protein
MTPPTARRRFAIASAAVALGIGATACGSDDEAASDPEPAETVAETDTGEEEAAPAADSSDAVPADGPTITVRGQDFSESITIAEVYGQFLQAQGYDVEILGAAGFRAEAVSSLENGDVDLIIDYIGGSLTELLPDAESSADADVIIEAITPAYAEIGATVLDYSPAVDGDALVARGDFDGTTISDLAGTSSVFGASAQCFERPQCFIGLTDPDIYGIEFGETVTLEFGPLLGEALSAGEVDVVVWNTTAPQITEEGFVVLEDDQGLLPAQNIAPIIDTEVLDAYGDALAAALNELSAAITTEDLLAWNTETDLELRESDEVATEWLEAEGLI